MQVSVLVLALCAGVAYSQVSPNPECLQPGAKLLDGQTAQLCYGKEQASIVKLTCDWERFGFHLEVIPDRKAKEIVLKQQAWLYNSASARAIQPEMPTDRQGCPVDSLPPHDEFFSFIAPAGKPDVDILFDNGRVNYSTTVVVNEFHYIDDKCTRQRFYVTDINLECCAIPNHTPNKTVTVPVHHECDLALCETTPDFKCQCRGGAGKDQDQWEISCKTTLNFASLGPNVGFQLSDLSIHPNGLGSSASPRLPLVTASLPVSSLDVPHLEISHALGPNYHNVTLNPVVFHPEEHHQKLVDLTAKASYCVIDPAQPVSQYLDFLQPCVDKPSATFFGNGPRSS